ncbi:MAG: MarR family transcriptional regulator, partial [Rhodanobacteraceae bacterium]
GECDASGLTQIYVYVHLFAMVAAAEIRETTQCLCLASRRAARTITRRFDRELRAHGLRATQFTLLSALHVAGPLPIGALAELLSSERTTVTRNLALVERHGFVTVRADPADARSRIAAITSKGSRALRGAMTTWRRVQSELTATIGTQTADRLRQLAGGPCVAGAHTRSRKPEGRPA